MKNKEDWNRKLDRLILSFGRIYNRDFAGADRMPDNSKFGKLELAVINLLEWDHDMPVNRIACHLDIPPSTLTSVLNRLEKKDILHREKNPDDKRMLDLKLTEFGKQLISNRAAEKKRMFKLISSSLDNQAEREELLKLLEKISLNLSGRQKDNS